MPEKCVSPLDAFERLCVEVIQLEAVATAADTAMDECTPPSGESRRAFNRAHALVSNTAEKATCAAELVEELKASVSASLAGERSRDAVASRWTRRRSG
jgi:hypothetical protein